MAELTNREKAILALEKEVAEIDTEKKVQQEQLDRHRRGLNEATTRINDLGKQREAAMAALKLLGGSK